MFICSLFQRICSMLAHIGQQAPGKRSEVRGQGLSQYTLQNYCVKGKTHQVTHQKYSESYFIPSNGDLSVISALTRWGDRPAAWRGQWWARNHAARRVGGHVRQGPHSVTGALVVHSHAVREGVTHRVVGLTIVAANLPRFPTGILRTEHKQIYKVHIYTHTQCNSNREPDEDNVLLEAHRWFSRRLHNYKN